jgi:transcription antitermination factor NusG
MPPILVFILTLAVAAVPAALIYRRAARRHQSAEARRRERREPPAAASATVTQAPPTVVAESAPPETDITEAPSTDLASEAPPPDTTLAEPIASDVTAMPETSEPRVASESEPAAVDPLPLSEIWAEATYAGTAAEATKDTPDVPSPPVVDLPTASAGNTETLHVASTDAEAETATPPIDIVKTEDETIAVASPDPEQVSLPEPTTADSAIVPISEPEPIPPTEAVSTDPTLEPEPSRAVILEPALRPTPDAEPAPITLEPNSPNAAAQLDAIDPASEALAFSLVDAPFVQGVLLDPPPAPHASEDAALAHRHIEPIKRGGRDRGRTEPDPHDPKPRRARSDSDAPRSTPDLVCIQRAGAWHLGIELGDDWHDDGEPLLVQDNAELLHGRLRDGVWELQTLAPVRLRSRAAEGEDILTLFAGGAADGLLFKLGGRGVVQGRLVKSLSRGSYLICAPDTWTRSPAAGRPTRAPEPMVLPGFTAHFVDIDGPGAEVAFDRPRGGPIRFASAASGFELSGERIDDANPVALPLFATLPPALLADDATRWDDIATVVVGEEGGRRWRAQFRPIPGRAKQHIGPLAERPGGTFFTRIYNRADEMVDSFGFRFLRGLHAIRVESASLLPTPTGHLAVTLRFVHDPGCRAAPANPAGDHPQPEAVETGSTVAIPPDPALDSTQWRIAGAGSASLSVTARLPRVWWTLANEHSQPEDGWTDKALAVGVAALSATSNQAIWLRLPPSGLDGALTIGFDRAQARTVAVPARAEAVAVPLRDFGDDPALDGTSTTMALKLWLRQGDRQFAATVALCSAPEVAQRQPRQEAAEAVVGPLPRSTERRPRRSARTDGDGPEAPPEILVEEHLGTDGQHLDLERSGYAWYSVSCVPGYESQVKIKMESMIQRRRLQESVPVILVPFIEKTLKTQHGKAKRSESFGYLLVQALTDDDCVERLIDLLRGTGAHLETSPIELEQLRRMLNYHHEPVPVKRVAKVGARLTIAAGLFAGQSAEITAIDAGRGEITFFLTDADQAMPITLPRAQVLGDAS